MRYHPTLTTLVVAAFAASLLTASATGASAFSRPAGAAPAGGPTAVAVPQRSGPPGVLMASHPLMLEVRGHAADGRPLYATGAPGGYTAGELRSYLRLHGTGAGQTVAIVDAFDDPYAHAELNAYSAQFGLPRVCPAKRSTRVAANCFGLRRLLPFGNGGIDTGWSLEESLDIEMVHALAPRASIDLVEARSNSLAALFKALGYAAGLHAAVISNSWGFGGELRTEASYDHYCRLATSVCTFSTGDAGHPGGYPAYNPSVVAVGGTTLSLTASGRVESETAWSLGGGGVSKYESRPAYQAATVNPHHGRGIPDVSFDADPDTGVAVYNVANGGWLEVGGTSVGAPAWAGILAVVDQLRAAVGEGPLTAAGYQAQQALYHLTQGLADITKGSNGGCGRVCTAGPGYDFVTGLGSPRSGIDTALAAARQKETRS
jgi:subtilase family serine protease